MDIRFTVFPRAASNLRSLDEYRRELGTTQFTSLLTRVADDPGLADAITSALDQLDKGDDSTTDPSTFTASHTPVRDSSAGTGRARPY